MVLSEDDFESWCFRNGGETYEEGHTLGLVCRFPDTETKDRVGYYSDNDVFEVITDGPFYSSRTFHQHAESWIDDDRLHIDTAEIREIIDPR